MMLEKDELNSVASSEATEYLPKYAYREYDGFVNLEMDVAGYVNHGKTPHVIFDMEEKELIVNAEKVALNLDPSTEGNFDYPEFCYRKKLPDDIDLESQRTAISHGFLCVDFKRVPKESKYKQLF